MARSQRPRCGKSPTKKKKEANPKTQKRAMTRVALGENTYMSVTMGKERTRQGVVGSIDVWLGEQTFTSSEMR